MVPGEKVSRELGKFVALPNRCRAGWLLNIQESQRLGKADIEEGERSGIGSGARR